MGNSQEYPDLPFVPPRSFSRGRDGNPVQFIVIHHTAGSERSTSAEDGAAYDARRTDGVSTHYFVDSNSIVQCVYTWDRAHAAHSTGNRRGIQYELCGTLQTRDQWLDAASDATLWNAARQIARDCRKYGLPVRKISPSQMLAGARGICGHADVTLAYRQGDHMDPGPNFPYDVLLQRVEQFMGQSSATQSGDDDMVWLFDITNDPTPGAKYLCENHMKHRHVSSVEYEALKKSLRDNGKLGQNAEVNVTYPNVASAPIGDGPLKPAAA
jgi:hypothetical protein